MSDNDLAPSSRSVTGTRNKGGIEHMAFADSGLKIAHLPNFEKVQEYIKLIFRTELKLKKLKTAGRHDPYEINIVKLLEECDLSYRNLAHFVGVITQGGKYGEIEKDGKTANLTTEALSNLIIILQENTIESFVERNLIKTSDFKNPRGVIAPITSETLARLIKMRGLDQLLQDNNPSNIAKRVLSLLKDGTHYEAILPGRHKPKNLKPLTESGVDFLCDTINGLVLRALSKYIN